MFGASGVETLPAFPSARAVISRRFPWPGDASSEVAISYGERRRVFVRTSGFPPCRPAMSDSATSRYPVGSYCNAQEPYRMSRSNAGGEPGSQNW